MNKEQFLKGMTYLTIAYNKEMTQEQIAIWYDFFKETNYDTFKQAVKRIIPTKKYMPCIAELKQEIVMLENPLLELDAEIQWGIALGAIKKYGRYRLSEAMTELNDYTKNILRQVGLERICNSTDIQWERKMFIELFNNSKTRQQNILALGEPVLTVAELVDKKRLKSDERLLIGDK